jgi:hypothetical protein
MIYKKQERNTMLLLLFVSLWDDIQETRAQHNAVVVVVCELMG